MFEHGEYQSGRESWRQRPVMPARPSKKGAARRFLKDDAWRPLVLSVTGNGFACRAQRVETPARSADAAFRCLKW